MSPKLSWFLGLTAVALLMGVASASLAGQEKSDAKSEANADAKVIVPFFGNEKCPMSGNPIDPAASVKVDGEKVYFCCKNCAGKAKADPKSWYAKAYAEPVKLVAETCPMSGQAIEAEKAQVVKYQGYEVTLCCGGCVKKFPGTAYSTLVKAKYPTAKWAGNKHCPMMKDEEVDSEVLAIYKGTVVNFCCDTCIDDFIDDPDTVMAALKDG